MSSGSGSLARWELEIGGQILLLDKEMVLGRDPSCEVPIEDPRVSWRHVKISPSAGGPVITDLGSRNGTVLNGRRLGSEPATVSAEAILQVGSIRARITDHAERRDGSQGRFRRVPLRTAAIRIGRAPENDIVLQELNVSWHHAEVRPGSPPTIVDLGSRNGVRFGHELLNGSGRLVPGTEAGIGPFTLRIENHELVVLDSREGLNLLAQQVAVQVPDKTILQPTDLRITSGEFIALIGPSGSGKSTLLKCLAGVSAPSYGQVLVGGEPLALRLTEVGYVPQSDVVHDRLTVRESLTYAARLRLPSDTRANEHAVAVTDVLEELRLLEHAETLIGRLSGGQRKRVSCGVELIGKPTMLLLDEPTSGLDPALERRLMEMLRHLADAGRGIVIVTHATSSLALCDTLAVMGPGGWLLFSGGPRESLEHFQVGAYDQIYDAVELSDPPPAAPLPKMVSQRPSSRTQLLSGRSLIKHALTLTGRYARTIVRDRRTLTIQLAQAPVMGLLVALLYSAHLLARPDHDPGRSAQFVFLLVTVSLWLGLIGSCREIVKERPIILRELAVGVRLDGYLLSKSLLLFSFAAVQCALVMATATAIQPLYAGPSTYIDLLVLMIMTSWAAVGIGLVVSTLARTVDQATSLIPLLLIPQLLFGAALVPFDKMQAPIKVLADLMASRWGFAAGGHLINMNARLADLRPPIPSGYGPNFFALAPGVAVAILAGMTAACLLLTAYLLASRARHDGA